MHGVIAKRSVLAVEIRRSCIGYAVFEGADRLLDWGATTPYPLESAVRRAEKRFSSILALLPSSIIVVKKPSYANSRGTLLGVLAQEAARHSVPWAVVTREDIRRTFCAKNKYEVAEALTRIFPELIYKLPPIRDTGDSERHAMTVFDAIATGYAYLQMTDIPEPPD